MMNNKWVNLLVFGLMSSPFILLLAVFIIGNTWKDKGTQKCEEGRVQNINDVASYDKEKKTLYKSKGIRCDYHVFDC